MLTRITEHRYVQHYGYAIIACLASILNYIIYPLLARIITPGQLGDVTALFSTNTQLAGIFTALNIVSIYVVKTKRPDAAKAILESVQKVTIYLFVILILVIVIASPLLKSVLNISFVWGFSLIGILLVETIPITIWIGYLQGHNKLIKAAVISFMISLLQLMMTLPLARIFGEAGAIWGYLLGCTIGLSGTAIILSGQLPKIGTIKSFSQEDRNRARQVIWFVVWSALVMFVLWLVQSIDIFYAKAAFSEQVAGLYAGISIFGRGIYFLGFVFIWVLLPGVDPQKPKNNKRLLWRGVFALSLLGAFGTLAVAAVGKQLINTLLGAEFLGQKNSLINSVLYKSMLLVITYAIMYLMVLRNRLSILLTAIIGLVIGFACLQHSATTADFLSHLVIATLVGVGIASMMAILANMRSTRGIKKD